MARIEDGTGQGYAAGVTSSNRLSVQAESIPSIAIASGERQDAYVINTAVAASATGLITGLVAGTESGVLWVQNNSPAPLAIGGISAGNTGVGVWKVWKSSTGGTVVSGGTLVDPVQLFVASSKGFIGSAYRANASGQTVGGGTVVALGYVAAGFTELVLQGALILGPTDTVALTFTPIGANADVSANMIVAYLG